MAKFAAVEEAVRQAKANDAEFKKAIVKKIEATKAAGNHGRAKDEKPINPKKEPSRDHVR